jgi:hypothetical protein
MKYRIFISIEEEDEETDEFKAVYDQCLDTFTTLEEAHEFVTKLEGT